MLNVLEILGVALGLICVYLATRHSQWNFVFTIASCLCYLVIFAQSKLYGDMALQVVYIALSIYGWYEWGRSEGQYTIKRLSIPQIGTAVGISLTLGLILGYGLSSYTDSDIAYIDGGCTAGSLVAQFLLSKRVLQNWWFWLAVDACYIPVYIYKSLYPTALLYAVYLLLALQGYYQWNKQYALSKSPL